MDTTTPPTAAPAPVQPQVVFVEKKSNGLATAAMVLGILAIAFSWIPFINVLSIPLAFVAIGLGIPGLLKALKSNIGKVKAIVGIALAALALVLGFAVNSAAVSAVDEAIDEIDTAISAIDKVEVTFGTAKTDALGLTEVPVTILNTSDETVSPMLSIAAESADGKTKYASTAVIVSDLAPGQTAKETASFLEKVPAGAKFVVTDK